MRKDRLLFLLPEEVKKPIRYRLLIFLVIVFLLPCTALTSHAQLRIDINVPKGSLANAFASIQEQTSYRFLYSTEDVGMIQIEAQTFKNASIGEVIQVILRNSGLTWQISDNLISIKKAPQTSAAQSGMTITGNITDTKGAPLMGVSVTLKGTNTQTMTDALGRFRIIAPAGEKNPILQFTYVGMKTMEVTYKGEMQLLVTMEETTAQIESVVVTGIFSRKQESFTGSASTYTASELKKVGSQNVLSSLKTLDPAFQILEDNLYGSDPNRLPDISIHGKTSIMGLTEEYGIDPNQPLFILDGFETSLATINNLSMDRVESITILKDAAATAIYGSKSANGVIVVETKNPGSGRLRVNYNGNLSLAWADLTDYNLMNASEKLEFERLSLLWGLLDVNGNFTNENTSAEYYDIMKEVARGVDTYWLNEPLRIAPSISNELYIEGGDEFLRYGAGIRYNNVKGVMKNSDKDVFNGSIRLLYRRGRISFNNTLAIENRVSHNPVVPFSRFADANPYFRKENPDGEVEQVLYSGRYKAYNPLYDMMLKNLDKNNSLDISNQFQFIWSIMDELRAQVRIGLNKTTDHGVLYKSRSHSDFIGVADESKGSYTNNEGRSFRYSGEANITYGKLFNGKHTINAVAGFKFSDSDSETSGYTVRGFVNDNFQTPSFARTAPNEVSYGIYSQRTASYYLNIGYDFMQHYMIDFSFRTDGTSVFGTDNHFSNVWSAGIAWNLHNESFIRNASWISLLKLRGSIGNPGNDNLSDYIYMRIYRYNMGNPNPFGNSLLVDNFGNKDLQWQTTIQSNAAIDIGFMQNRLKVSLEFYRKDTDPLLVNGFSTPSSTGVTSIITNMGRQVSQGFTITTNYFIIDKQDLRWSINANLRHGKTEYRELGDALKRINTQNQGLNLRRYYDGGSPTDLWAVRSAGIDPGTGLEIFITKDGRETFEYSTADEVIVGNSTPKAEGVIGTTLFYKGLSVSMNFRYCAGGQKFMQTLFNKVEGIKYTGRETNKDKRALYDRWKEVGDNAKYRKITNYNEDIKMSSRFVMDENTFSGEAFSLSYDTQARWVNKIGASSLTFRFNMNDLFRISTIKNERGIYYPFQRLFSFSIGARF